MRSNRKKLVTFSLRAAGAAAERISRHRSAVRGDVM